MNIILFSCRIDGIYRLNRITMDLLDERGNLEIMILLPPEAGSIRFDT